MEPSGLIMNNRKSKKILDDNEFGFEPVESYRPMQEFGFEPVESYSKTPQKQMPAAAPSQYKDMPWYLKGALGALQSAQEPIKRAIPERINALEQGFLQLGQGAKQLFSGRDYTKQVEAQRKAYEATHAGQDPLSNWIREQPKEIPYMLAMGLLGPAAGLVGKAIPGAVEAAQIARQAMQGPPRKVGLLSSGETAGPWGQSFINREGGNAGNLIKNMLKTGGAFAGIKGAEFTPENQDRLSNMVKAGLTGAALELAPQALRAPEAAKNLGRDVFTGELFTGSKKYAELAKKLGIESQQAKLSKAQQAEQKAARELEVIAPIHAESELKHIEAEKQAGEAAEAFEQAKANYKETKDFAKSKLGLNDPDSMQFQISKNQEKLKEIDQNIDALHYQMDNLPSVPKPKPSEIGHIENVNTAAANVKVYEDNLKKAEETQQQANIAVQQSELPIADYLKEGEVHDVPLAERTFDKLDTNRARIGNEFNEITNDFEKRNVTVNNEDQIHEKLTELSKFLQKHEGDHPEGFAILDQIKALEKEHGKKINAADFMRMYQSVSQYAREARNKAYQTGMDAQEREQWKQRYNQLDHLVDQMGNALEKGVGTKNKERLETARKEWKEQVVPLYDSNVYHEIKKYGRMSGDVMQNLRGTKHAGNELIKNAIKSDPESLQYLVGDAYKQGPAAREMIYNKKDVAKEYVDLMPELNKLIEARKEALGTQEKAKVNIDRAKEFLKTHKEFHEQALKASEEYKKQAGEEFKTYETKVSEKEKEQSRLQQEITTHKEGKTKIEKRVKNLENHLDEIRIKENQLKTKEQQNKIKTKQLKLAKSRKDINLKQKDKLEREFEKHQKEVASTEKQIHKLSLEKKMTHFGIKKLTHGLVKYGSKLKNFVY